MNRIRTAIVALLMLFAMVGCTVPGDEPGEAFADGLIKHTALIKEDKFDKDAFMKEMKPLAEQLSALREKSDNDKVEMSEDILNKYKSATDDFAAAAKEKLNFDASFALVELGMIAQGKGDMSSDDNPTNTKSKSEEPEKNTSEEKTKTE